MPLPVSDVIRIYAERAEMSPAAALAYRFGALEARTILANAANLPTERTTNG